MKVVSTPLARTPLTTFVGSLGVLLVVCLIAACNQQNQVVVPNRVLDRPLDVALGCVRLRDDGRVEALSLNLCAAAGAASCSEQTTPQLIGFVANSEKNEVAMWRRCDTRAGIVDLDNEAPGYQLIPVGTLPSSIVSTGLGCRVVTANAGSCDLSILNGRALGAYALDVPTEAAPSELVSTLLPRDADGEVLASRPGILLAVPERLTQAAPLGGDAEDTGGMVGGTDGGDETGISDPEGTDGSGGVEEGPLGEFSLCPAGKPESVYVTFPNCQLVAEVSLASQRILQSRRFVTQGDGTVVVEDAGSSPVCPVDCPKQFSGAIPDRGVTVDPGDFFPSTIELLQEIPDEDQDPDFGDAEVTHSALYVGGLGSDQIFEIKFERGANGLETGQWEAPDESLSLLLDDARGVHAIRVTPTTLAENGFSETHQFLYVVAGDGSTRVVDRDFDLDRFGAECDTQRDPSLGGTDQACVPIEPRESPDDPVFVPPDRRPFAVGPGIRAGSGAAITDWTFQRVKPASGPDRPTSRSPFGVPGVIGIGVTSFGRVIFSTFEQFRGAPTATGIDPVGIMNLSVGTHALWPGIDPTVAQPEITALPRLDDFEPDRALPGPENTPQELAPSLRRIDLAYTTLNANEEDALGSDAVSDQQRMIAEALGGHINEDTLGSFLDDAGLYEEPVARVAVRDYQTWTSQAWSMVWEGSIPGTRAATGRIECAYPGWEGGTCRVGGVPDDGGVPLEEASQLVDEAATFCDNGVLPGDTLVLIGCSEDSDCGLGQGCLQEPTAPANAGGICVSSQALENDFERLRAACAPFIDDPCGQPEREYLISRAFQNRLHLQLQNIQPSSHVRVADLLDDQGNPVPGPDGDPQQTLVEIDGRYTCRLPYATDAAGAPMSCTADTDCAEDYLCSNDGVCRGPCPGGDPECRECTEDAECDNFDPNRPEGTPSQAICSDGLCRRPCTPGDPDCVRMPLPGPRCFAELADYVVRVRHSFLVQGDPNAPFLSNSVFADPNTGECIEDPNVSNLLSSRLRLGADEASTFGDPYFGIADCPNPDEAAPTDPNPCRIAEPREVDPKSLFHYFSYNGTPVEAIRFSNPFLSVILDLTSLDDLARPPPLLPEGAWPSSFARFKRSRIPRNYREVFTTQDGYIPFNEPVIVGSVPMVYPVRIINGPELGAAFIVDAGGRGGVTGVRGQVIRIDARNVSEAALADENFRVR